MLGRFFIWIFGVIDYDVKVGHSLDRKKRQYYLILTHEITKKEYKFNIRKKFFKKIFKYITSDKKINVQNLRGLK